MRVLAEKQGAVDALRVPVFADCLGDRVNVGRVEARSQAASAMPAGAECDALRRVAGIRQRIVERALERGDIDENIARRGLAGTGVDAHYL